MRNASATLGQGLEGQNKMWSHGRIFYAYGNELKISSRGRRFLSQLSERQFLLMDFAPQSKSVAQTSLNNEKKVLHVKCKDEFDIVQTIHRNQLYKKTNKMHFFICTRVVRKS